MDEIRRDRWDHVAEWPLTAAAVLFLIAYAWPILDTGLSDTWVEVCRVTTWVTWATFVVDYGVRWSLSVERWRFVKSNLLDLLVVALPILRPLRLLRLVALLNILNRAAGGSFRGRVAVYVVGSSVLVLFVSALAVLNAERDQPGANIETFPDALWWAATTVTTVGYGDEYPVTPPGRFIAVGLMIAGIALIGVVTATFASWLIERVEQVAEESRAASRRDIAELEARIETLLTDLRDSLSPPRPEPRADDP